MENKKTRRSQRLVRSRRIRAVVAGTTKRPRLAVYRSGTALFVQLIDDEKGVTLASERAKGKNAEVAIALGKEIAAAAKAKKITAVVFDRGGNRYHGAIRALADAAREGGLKF